MEYSYKHRVNYYETDAMGMTHHSNYVRWMEEARVYMMDKFGYSYKRLEGIGIASPVIGYKCDIKHSTYFDDEITIKVRVLSYNSVRLSIGYEMSINEKVVAVGETNHCFTNKSGMPVRLNRESEELDKIIKKELEKV